MVQASAIVEMLVGRVPRTDRDQCPSVMKRSFCAAAIASNDRFPFRKLPLREAPVKGYFWPKAAVALKPSRMSELGQLRTLATYRCHVCFQG